MKKMFITILFLTSFLFGSNDISFFKTKLDSLKTEGTRINNKIRKIDNEIERLIKNPYGITIDALAFKIDSMKTNKDGYLNQLKVINTKDDSLSEIFTNFILTRPIEPFKGIIKKRTGLYRIPIKRIQNRMITLDVGEVVDIIDIGKSRHFVKINYHDTTGFIHVYDVLTDKEKLSKLQEKADAIKKMNELESKEISSELSNRQKTSTKTNTSLKYSTQINNDDLQVLYDSGLLKKLDIDLNEAWIDVYIWNSLDYDTKVGIGITLAKICDRAGSTGRITFYDNRSGKKVARYSQSYGYKSY